MSARLARSPVSTSRPHSEAVNRMAFSGVRRPSSTRANTDGTMPWQAIP